MMKVIFFFIIFGQLVYINGLGTCPSESTFREVRQEIANGRTDFETISCLIPGSDEGDQSSVAQTVYHRCMEGIKEIYHIDVLDLEEEDWMMLSKRNQRTVGSGLVECVSFIANCELLDSMASCWEDI